MSRDGVLIRTDMLLAIDAELALRIRLPGDSETMYIKGRVVWLQQASKSSPAGMGVEFITMPYDHKRKINAFVEERAGELRQTVRCESLTGSSA
jgi:Tfp pilus assembly protein PilZ